MKNKKDFIIDIVAGIVSIGLMVLGIVGSKNGYELSAAIVFGCGMILYSIFNSLHHGIEDNEPLKRLSYVSLLIAFGCILSGFYIQKHTALSWTFFGVTWGLILLSIIFVSIGFSWMRIGKWIFMIGMILLLLIDLHTFHSNVLIPLALFIVSMIFDKKESTYYNLCMWTTLLSFYGLSLA